MVSAAGKRIARSIARPPTPWQKGFDKSFQRLAYVFGVAVLALLLERAEARDAVIKPISFGWALAAFARR